MAVVLSHRIVLKQARLKDFTGRNYGSVLKSTKIALVGIILNRYILCIIFLSLVFIYFYSGKIHIFYVIVVLLLSLSIYTNIFSRFKFVESSTNELL